MSSIFLSYSSNDWGFVGKLEDVLKNMEVKVWIDKAEIKAGDSLIKKITEGIEDVEFLGAVLSKNFIKSPWVEKELLMAMTQQIKGRKMKVLPIVIDDCKIPLFLEDIKYVDFRNKDNFDKGVMELLDVIMQGHPMHMLRSQLTNEAEVSPKRPKDFKPIKRQGKAICHECVYHRFDREPLSYDTSGIVFSGTKKEKAEFLRTIWYNQICTCKASTKKILDYTSGMSHIEYGNCRDFNIDGKCKYCKKLVQ